MKKVVSIFLACAMSVGMLTACGNETETATKGASGGLLANDEPIEATIFYVTGASGAFSSEWAVFKKAAEMTNVSLKGVLNEMNTDAASAYNLMMASGDVADIVATSKDNIFKYVVQGAYVDLTDLIDEYAPHIKKFFDEHPNIRKSATYADGKIYFIPFIADGKTSGGWYVRKDWLRKLNLDEPKNVDEFYNVLKAFKEQDPNGNGKQDEIPYFQRSNGITELYPLFGVRPYWSIKNDKPVYGQYTKEYKTAVKTVAKWYKEGLIDREIFTRAQNARTYALQENVGGITHDWFTSTSAFNKILADKIEGFDFRPMIPPEDINGKRWENTSRSQSADYGWGITTLCKNPEVIMKYMDFWFTDEGKMLINFGIEGETYTMVDGKPMFTEKILDGEDTVLSKLQKCGAQLQNGIGYPQDYWYEEQTLEQDVRDDINEYIDGGYIAEPMPSLSFTEEEQKKISEKFAPIKTYISETEQQWIMGSKDVDSTFDEYMQTLKKMGMDEIIDIYNSAYQRYKKS